MNKDELISQLIPKVHEKIVVNLVDYYCESKSEFLKGNSEQASFKSGKFVEEICRALEYIRTEKIKDKIDVNTTIETLRKLSDKSQPETIRLIIPRVLFAIYTFRNKRNVAHTSSEIDPLFMDAKFCISGIDWIMSELLRLFHNYSEEEIEKIIKEIIRKQIPMGQTIGDTTIPFDETLNLSDSFLVILYLRSEPVDANTLSSFSVNYYPNKYHPVREDTPKVLKKLKMDRYILGEYYNDFVITEKGIKYVDEKLIDKILSKINS